MSSTELRTNGKTDTKYSLGEKGESLLVARFKELQWQKEQYNKNGLYRLADKHNDTMERIVEILGYTPS